MFNGLCFVLSLCLMLFALGCQSEPEITSYTAPRTDPVSQEVDAEQLRAEFDHMLAAIVPHEGHAWFFKAVGPVAAVDRHRQAFEEFIAGVSFNEGKPTWQLPEGWHAEGASEMRFDTIVIPDEPEPLEISVSSLPLRSEWKDFLTRNVNRWLGQLSQAELSSETIMQFTRQIPTEAGDATIVELAGKMKSQPGMSNPHAGMSGSASPPSEQPTQPAPPGPLQYETPESWQSAPGSAMRKASFAVAEGDLSADISVMSFPDSPNTQMGEVEANVARWAGQVGLSGLGEPEIQQRIQPMQIDGFEANYVELYGPGEEATTPAILAAMLNREGEVWFFKMSGHRGLVEQQTSAFREFLDSVRFP